MNLTYLTRTLTIFASIGLTACVTVGPDYKPPSIDAPAGWNRLEQTSNSEVKATPTGDLSQWWQNLNDRLLSELIDEAMQSSPDLRSAQARLREARARGGVASARLYPSVTASGNARRSSSSKESGSGNTVDLFNAGFDATWELDLFGGVRRGIEAASADVESSVASLHDTQVSLAAEIATNYVEVRSLQTRLTIARDNLSSQSETLQLTDWRAQAGLVSSQDVEQARSNREQTRAQIPSLETALAAAEHNLDILIGKTPGTLHERLAKASGLPLVSNEIAVGIPADTVRQRPDVMIAERRLAAETARVGVAEAARYPSFKLSGSIGLEALSIGALGNSGATTSSLLAGITAPIFDAGRLKNQVVIQDAVREQAQIAYEKTVLTALQEVENALVSLARNKERSDALTIATASATSAAEMARQRYSAGLIDFQPVLDTERSVRAIEDTLATTRADGILSLIRLYKALGGGWSTQKTEPLTGKDKL